MIKVYTDGGCHGNPGPGGWAAVILKDGQEKKISGGQKETTNNRMELSAVIEALALIRREYPDVDLVEVHTDSQYVKNGITRWILNWIKNGWRTSAKQPVKNKELWQPLKEVSDALPVEWFWVKGHAGDKYNELCDQMVQEAIAPFE